MILLEIITIVIILQRLSELVVSKRNIAWALQRGGVEHGADHYWMFITLHTAWIVSFNVEWLLLRPSMPPFWPVLLASFIAAQVLRYWAISTLGKRWNTRIIVLNNEPLIARGPYRWLRHPNYLAVIVEIFVVPAMLGDWITASLFTIANAALLLLVRIPAENAALRRGTGGGT